MSETNPLNSESSNAEYAVNYIPEQNQFQVTIDGKYVDISPLQAVLYVLQHRYVVMSEVTAEKTREMQQQIKAINEASAWLNAVTDAATTGVFTAPDSTALPATSYGGSNGGGSNPNIVTITAEDASEQGKLLVDWMNANGLDTTSFSDPPTLEDFTRAQTQISNYVDQLSSNNDLRMLSLKSAVNRAEEALTAADGVLQNIKQLMQTIVNNMAR